MDVFADVRPLDTLRVAKSPFAKVVKERGALRNILGLFNMRKAGSPWRDRRLRQAANHAIKRAHLIRYAAKGNGVILPALLPPRAFGYDPTLKPYAFDPVRAQRLLREASHPNGLALTLIAPHSLVVQATVVSKIVEHVGFTVHLELLDMRTMHWRTHLYNVPAQVRANPTFDPVEARHTWDIALKSTQLTGSLAAVFPTPVYRVFALDGHSDWVIEHPTLRDLYKRLIPTTEQEQQRTLIHQMERHTRDQAYLLFLYNLIQLYAANKHVTFDPHPSGNWLLSTTSLTGEHWSMRQTETMSVGAVSTHEQTTPQSRLPLNDNLQRPEGDGPFPAVMLVSGGSGFSTFTMTHARYMDAARQLQAQGYVVLFVDTLGRVTWRRVERVCHARKWRTTS